MDFEGMSFGAAVSYVRTVSLATTLLFLSVPLGAGLAILRGKRNRPGGRLLFPWLVLWGWGVLVIAAVAYFLTGNWYGENGPAPQVVAVQATMSLMLVVAVVSAIHLALCWTTRPGPRP